MSEKEFVVQSHGIDWVAIKIIKPDPKYKRSWIVFKARDNLSLHGVIETSVQIDDIGRLATLGKVRLEETIAQKLMIGLDKIESEHQGKIDAINSKKDIIAETVEVANALHCEIALPDTDKEALRILDEIKAEKR